MTRPVRARRLVIAEDTTHRADLKYFDDAR